MKSPQLMSRAGWILVITAMLILSMSVHVASGPPPPKALANDVAGTSLTLNDDGSIHALPKPGTQFVFGPRGNWAIPAIGEVGAFDFHARDPIDGIGLRVALYQTSPGVALQNIYAHLDIASMDATVTSNGTAIRDTVYVRNNSAVNNVYGGVSDGAILDNAHVVAWYGRRYYPPYVATSAQLDVAYGIDILNHSDVAPSGYNFRSRGGTGRNLIEGQLWLSGLPTSDPHSYGQLWTNNGVLMVSGG